MSMCIHKETVETNIYMSGEDAGKAFDILKQVAFGQKELCRITFEEVEQSSNFEQLADAFGWKPVLDEDGNIIDLKHTALSVREEELFFKTIAPFVKAGSVIEYEREGSFSNQKKRFEFKNADVVERSWVEDYDQYDNTFWSESV